MQIRKKLQQREIVHMLINRLLTIVVLYTKQYCILSNYRAMHPNLSATGHWSLIFAL